VLVVGVEFLGRTLEGRGTDDELDELHVRVTRDPVCRVGSGSVWVGRTICAAELFSAAGAASKQFGIWSATG
jgi:hypothetical protein